MAHRWNKIAQLSALAACCSLAVWISASNAKDDGPVLVKKPTVAADNDPALPPPSKPTPSAQQPSDLFAPEQPQAQPPKPSIPPQQSPKVVLPPQAPQQQKSPPQKSAAKRPFMRPALPREPADGKLTALEEPMPAPEGAVIQHPPLESDVVIDGAGVERDVRPSPPITYDTDGDARKMYRATGEIRLVMFTQDPSDGCYYKIPLCIPGCCVGDPIVKGGRGLLGRGVVEYCWPCGFRAIVKFRRVLGDVRVDYEGD